MKNIWRNLMIIVVISLYELADYIERLSDKIAYKNDLVIENTLDSLFDNEN